MKTQQPILSEEKLIAAIQGRKPVGAEALYNMYSKSLYGVITKMVPNQETAEDALQETFIKIWNNIDKYEPAKGRLFTWMVAIARNLTKDLLISKNYKRGRNTLPIDDNVQAIERGNYVLMNTDFIGVQLFLSTLKSDQSVIFDLIYYKGYTHQEVAQILNIPLGTVKTRWRLGILALRAIYNYEIKTINRTDMVA